MIEFRNLSKTYAAAAPAALRDVNLSIPRGGVFGVIGPSGAGKSTLIRMINRLERPTSGEVWVEGQNIATFDAAGLSTFRRRVGMIFQQFGLLASKTALQNVMFPLRLAGQSATAAEAKARSLLKRVGLEAHVKKYPAQLSGGQKQRVGIARALANDPDILLCDEATSALDPQATRDILQLLSALNRDLGLTIVLITHEMEVVRQVCDQVAVLDGGSVVETGAVADVFLHPRHSATRRLVREADAGDAADLIGPVFRLGATGGESAGRSLIAALAGLGDDIQVLTCRVAAIKETPYALARIAVAEPKLEATVAKLRAAGVHVEAEA